MRSLFLLALSLFLFASCGNDEADPAPEPIAEVAPTYCEDESELIIVEAQLGDGVEAVRENVVIVNYEGHFEDGEVFDSGESVQFSLDQVIPGFREGIAGMKIGGRRELTIPPTMGYGPDGQRNPDGSVAIPPCATLIFDIELLEIEH